MSGLKLTPLETEIWDLWHRLVFEEGYYTGGPKSDAEQNEIYQRQAKDWQRLHELCLRDGQWCVGVDTAVAVTGSLWIKFMIQRDFRHAEETILLW
ncbi:MAG: hypothetical protein ACAH95_06950, partial [Fimbriimonas sp.]